MAPGEPDGYESYVCGLLVYSSSSGKGIGDSPAANADKSVACEAFPKGNFPIDCSWTWTLNLF